MEAGASLTRKAHLTAARTLPASSLVGDFHHSVATNPRSIGALGGLTRGSGSQAEAIVALRWHSPTEERTTP
ncbi:hypothetical protein Acsp05_15490 [Actinokineospora sp. NBRC 105648]|nr:hypothetical protein Acsp05_15490 [Actinokineospora sp. NBRC 105648]